MKNIINLVLSFLFVFQCHSGFAEDLLISAGSEEGALFQFPVWYRMRAYKLDSFPLDSKETFNSQQVFFRHQLRFSPSISFEKDLRIIFEADAFSGLIAGDKDKNTGDYLLLPEDEYTGRGRFDLRKAYISWKMDAGVLRFGQQASNFGLGLIANSGDGEDDWFSDNGLGDISERFMFITTPLIIFSNSDWAKSVYLAFGADLVYRDDNADLMDGDTAYQGVASLMYNTEDIKAGFYLAVRRQEDDKGTILNANAYDLYFDFKKNLTDQLSFSAGFEGAVISGYTDRVISYGARKGLDILSAGAVLKTGIAHKGLSLNFDALFGYASGDNNPSDSETRAFFFDPDFKAGMILFEEVLARATARTTEIVTDPELMGYPPIGVSAIPTDGSITNAFFINPVARYYGLKGLDLRLGFLFAMNPAEMSDPYASSKYGKYNRNFLGNATKSWGVLGYEFNGSVSYRFDIYKSLAARFGVRGGFFIPGASLDGLGNIYKVTGLFDIYL